ncbi:MAG TPA: aminodeoxychorismate synthase component I [Thermoleophilaceae bacterium]
MFEPGDIGVESSLATQGNGVRAVRVALAGSVPAGHEALLVSDDSQPFALIGSWAGARALVGSAPARIAAASEDPFALLAEAGPRPRDVPPGFVGGGWVGSLGFALAWSLESLASPAPAREQLPAFALARYDHVLRLDRDGQWWFEALWTPARAEALDERRALLQGRLERGVGEPGPVVTEPWRAEPSASGHARAVAACQARIAAGDLYQANLSLRLRSTLRGRPVDLFARAAAALGPERAAYLGGDRAAIASVSPELFLERRGEYVRSAPIKGTRPRPADSVASRAERAALAASSKDRAENVMIVDLVRNDLGRVCLPGSVEVTTLAEPQAHPGVWHLVSEIEGQLAPGVGDGDLLRAAFPPGSVTGAPKIAALGVISELESAARQAFTGAIGFVSPTAGMELSVTIRTFELREGEVWLDVGGGVVADSDPAGEAAEALTKARPLLAAIGADLAMDARPDNDVPPPRRLGPRPVPRPDPAVGVFETLLVRDGEPVSLEGHIDRLAESGAVLYGLEFERAPLARHLRQLAANAAAPCRLRVILEPAAELRFETAPLPDTSTPLTLAAVTVPGGLGAYKWHDRRLVDALTAAVAPATPLLVDLDGGLLEAAWGNVFLVDAQGVLATPPLDGRILPGIARARTLERARSMDIDVAERPLTLADLNAAREVLLTSALRQVAPVGTLGPVAVALG